MNANIATAPMPWFERLLLRAQALGARVPRSVFALPLAGVAAVAVLFINETSYHRSTRALARLEQRAAATSLIQLLMRRLGDAETGQRGYLLTGRRAYLQPYEQTAADTARILDWLHDYYRSDPGAIEIVDALRSHARERLAELQEAVAAYDASERERWLALIDSEGALRHTTALRQLASQLIERERAYVAADRKAVVDTLSTSRIGVNATAAVGLLALLMVLRQTAALEAIQRRHTLALHAERERLEAEVRQRTADLTQLARHLHNVREDESSRLARDLHDELGALLTTTKLDVARLKRALAGRSSPELLARLDHLSAGIDSGIALKRRIIEDLRPLALTNLGLVSAIEIQLRDFGERAGVELRSRLEPLSLSDTAQITAYRLVQEALTNIGKYARARRVEVTLVASARHPQMAELVVADDGQGFDTAAPRLSAHGLRGMRYRVEAVGGTLEVRSQPGKGTRIEALLPIEAPPSDATDEGRTAAEPGAASDNATGKPMI